MSDRWNSKWRSPPSWIYYFCLLWSNGLFPVTAVYISAKFHSSTSIAAELLLLVQKSKMAAAAILNYNLNYEVHLCTWNSHWNFVLIECVQYFWRYRNSKILRTWLKISIQTPKIMFLGSFDLPKHYFFIIETPKWPYLTRKHAFWAINGRDWSSVWLVGVSKNAKKDRTQKVTENAFPRQTPFPSSRINQILHVRSYLGYLSCFWVSLKSVENVGTVGVEILAFT